jgi:1,4-dihydroxy-2-naphthoate octaprenyltransferase
MKPAFWIKALRIIPRIEKEEWDKLDPISKWLVLTRSAVFVITFIPASIAGIFAFLNDKFNFLNWLLLTLGLIFAHATNNMLNDFTDHIKNVDKDNYFRAQYGPHALEHGLMDTKGFFKYVVITGILALLIGIYFVYLRGLPALILLIIGSFFVLFYTYPLKYIGLGELAVFIVWGPLMIWGGYYAITGEWNWDVFIASLPYGLGATTVLFGKHIDKLEQDKQKGIRTLPVILGERNARITAIILMLLQYLITVYLVFTGFFRWTMLIVLLGLKRFWTVFKIYKEKKPKERPSDYPQEAWPLWYVAFAFWHNRTFGALYLLGLIFEVIFKILKV